MLIIGLVGGTPENRINITTTVMEQAPSRICCYMMTVPETGMERVKALDAIVCDLDPKSRTDTMILTHVETPEEVELIRSIGGFIWHVDGRPSDVIAAERGDYWVSHSPVYEHWLTPEEAFAESTMKALRSV